MIKEIAFKELFDSSLYVDHDEETNSYKILTTETKADATNLKIISAKELFGSTIKVHETEEGKIKLFI